MTDISPYLLKPRREFWQVIRDKGYASERPVKIETHYDCDEAAGFVQWQKFLMDTLFAYMEREKAENGTSELWMDMSDIYDDLSSARDAFENAIDNYEEKLERNHVDGLRSAFYQSVI